MIKEISPYNLLQDKTAALIIEVIDQILSKLPEQIKTLLIYPRIDELSGDILDLLGWQFHVEGWELAESEEEKRNLIKNAILLHKYKGTKWALKHALNSIGVDAEIVEWFDYGGAPYKFKVRVDLLTRGIDEETFDLLKDMILEYKNARSWLESLVIYLTNKSAIPVFVPKVLSGEEITVYPHNITELQQNGPLYYGLVNISNTPLTNVSIPHR